MKELIPYFLVVVPLAPLAAAFINAIVFGYAEREKKEKLQYVTIFISILAVMLALVAHFVIVWIHPPLMGEGSATIVSPVAWLALAYPVKLNWAIRYDALTSVMVAVVLFVGLMVNIFSVGYLADRRRDYGRYFAWLSFFMFSMLILVLAANMFVFFLGWEAVGVSSYKLIAFYIEKDAAQRAGKKAFIMNRIGDAALLIAMFAIFRVANTADFRAIAMAFSKGSIAASHANFIALMVFIAAAAKSAQFPLYTWLPDAMTGPTPVSALIHAATMVTAGIFLMLRLEPIFTFAPEASVIVAYTGGLTAFIAAFIAAGQTDIKKVLAFSTVSQLGFMVVAVGTGAYTAAFFHLFTHAFFKAMLFLGAGAVITYLHHEQNIRHMGGIARTRPMLAGLFWLALAALAGIPGLSGFFSKDHILAAAFAFKAGGGFLGVLVIVTSLLTAFYSFRLGIIVFHGKNHHGQNHQTHGVSEPTISYYLPLGLLAIPTAIAGWFGLPVIFTGYESGFMEFLSRNLPLPTSGIISQLQGKVNHETELWFMAISVVVVIAGATLAIFWYGILGRRPVAEGAYRSALPRLSLAKLFVDEIYHALIVAPYRTIANKITAFELNVLPAISDGIAQLTQSIGAIFARMQSGVLANYVTYMLVGILIMLVIVMGSV